jgi:hypothetical protein
MNGKDTERFDRLERKIDKLLEEIVPSIRTEIAVMNEKSSNSAKIITGVGGAITLMVSLAAAHWMK